MGGRASKGTRPGLANAREDLRLEDLHCIPTKELAQRLEEIMEHRRLSQQVITHQNIQARRSAYARSASQPVSCLYSVFCSCWSMGHKFSWVVQDIIDGIQAGESEKLQLWEYYVKMVEQYDEEARRAGWWLTHLQFLRTTFNIVLPAILALQNLGSLSFVIMWLTWGLSLVVSLSTGYIDLFRLQSRYEMLKRSAEYLKIEGWQFFGLIGRYSSYKNNPNQHQAALHLFLYRIAKIKKRILDMEFPPKNDSQDSSYNTHEAPSAPARASQPTSVGPSYGSPERDEEMGLDSMHDISALMKGPAFRESIESAFKGSPHTPHTPPTRRSIASHISERNTNRSGTLIRRPNTPTRTPTQASCSSSSPASQTVVKPTLVRPTSVRPTLVRPTLVRPASAIPVRLPIPLTPVELNREALDTDDERSDDEAIRM